MAIELGFIKLSNALGKSHSLEDRNRCEGRAIAYGRVAPSALRAPPPASWEEGETIMILRNLYIALRPALLGELSEGLRGSLPRAIALPLQALLVWVNDTRQYHFPQTASSFPSRSAK